MPVNVSPIRLCDVVIPRVCPVCAFPSQVVAKDHAIRLQTISLWLDAIVGVVVHDQCARANSVHRRYIAPVVVVVVHLLRPAASSSFGFCSVAEDFDVVKMAMPYDEFTPCTGIPASVCRKSTSGAVVAIPILKEKEVRAAVASQLRPYLVPITPGTCTVESSVLPKLTGNIVFHNVIGHPIDGAVYSNVIGMVKIGKMEVVEAHLI